MFRYLGQVLFLLVVFPLFAQDSLKVLDEIRILATPIHSFSAGSKVQQADSATLALMAGLSLADYLQLKSPVYIKQYGGLGMQASISFRGTGANHTAVLWNGININSMLLGQTDFGLLQVDNFENIALQYGSAASLVGSDAIGGTLHLENNILWQAQQRHQLRTEIGSFGKWTNAYTWQKSTQKWYFRTQMNTLQVENNFSFRNTKKIGQPVEIQKNAAFSQESLQNDIYYKMKNGQYLAFKFWIQNNFRNVQPTMNDLGNQDTQRDFFIRNIVEWKGNKNWGEWHIKTAFLYDYFKFSSFESLHTYQQIIRADFEKNYQKLRWRTGIQSQRISTQNINFDNNKEEYRHDFYFFSEYIFNPKLRANLNFRQSFVTHFRSTPTPSLGLEWKILKKNAHQLQSKILLGRAFKVPTLNDRFWQRGGNPNLLPETSLSLEKNFLYDFKKENIELQAELSFFQMYVQNWILWQPTGNFWSAQNVAQVRSSGAELSAWTKLKYASGSTKIGFNYAYTQSINQSPQHEYDRSVGKQLPYTPLHKANLYYFFNYKKWTLHQNFSYTGKRFTSTDNENFLEAFCLVDISLNKNITILRHSLNLSFQVLNLLAEEYQNYENRAMPQRHFRLSIRYQFL